MKVCVIGGGAAGMMCATMIARKGHVVHLYEKNEKLGKKIYITGKGRCNVTNATVGDEFLKNVVNGKKFVMGAITRFNSNDTMKFFEDLQVPLKIERGNRVFPVSDKSSDIIKGLEKAMHWAGVEVHLNSCVQKIITQENAITGILLDGKQIDFDAVVVATGGVSYPSTGSTGDGYKFAESVGHTVVSQVPSLCAVILSNPNQKLEGLSLKNVQLVSKVGDKVVYKSEIGEMLFTSNGISGPLVLSTSAFINRIDFSKLNMFIDFKPALSIDSLLARIDRDIVALKAKQVSSLLEGFLPKSICADFAKRLKINLTMKANQLNKENRKNLAYLLKNYELKPQKLESFDAAVVTSGGVNLKEINPKFMRSKLVSGLYFIGEVLDIDALTGGFNLQLAFSTAVTCASDFKDLKGA
ncbi:MAG: NAD(P)/FAD-dependent oxidoreductase [Clostridia bacterium]|nr:NAD(P)/FAD-dependent oxidoreductase [Clostridia bacterium]